MSGREIQAAVALWQAAEDLLQEGDVEAAIKCLDSTLLIRELSFVHRAHVLHRLAAVYLFHVVPIAPNDSQIIMRAKAFTDQAFLLMKNESGAGVGGPHVNFVLALHAQRISQFLVLRELPGHSSLLENALAAAVSFSVRENSVRWFLYFNAVRLRIAVDVAPRHALLLLDECMTAARWDTPVIQLWFLILRFELLLRIRGLGEQIPSVVAECERLLRQLIGEQQLRGGSEPPSQLIRASDGVSVSVSQHESGSKLSAGSSSGCAVEEKSQHVEPDVSLAAPSISPFGSVDVIVLRTQFGIMHTWYLLREGRVDAAEAALAKCEKWVQNYPEFGSAHVDILVPSHAAAVSFLALVLLSVWIRPQDARAAIARGLKEVDERLSSLSPLGNDLEEIFLNFRALFLELESYLLLSCDPAGARRSIMDLRTLQSRLVSVGRDEVLGQRALFMTELLESLLEHSLGRTRQAIVHADRLISLLPTAFPSLSASADAGRVQQPPVISLARLWVVLRLHLAALLFCEGGELFRSRGESTLREVEEALQNDNESSLAFRAVLLFLKAQALDGDAGASNLRESLRLARSPLRDRRLMSLALMDISKILGADDPTVEKDLLGSALRLARGTNDLFVQVGACTRLVEVLGRLGESTHQREVERKLDRVSAKLRISIDRATPDAV